ncbi:MAG: hypothetical protein F6K36_10935 [Symploca sp. SIO3C6]|nr:hypothetical protein [Symploca sp. SIO3C6]
MNAAERLARIEAAEIARWLTPIPRIDVPVLADGQGEDQGVGNHFSDDGSLLPDLGPLTDFGSWASVLSTIDKRSLTTSGFNPADPNFDMNAWLAYADKFGTNPFFLNIQNQFRRNEISSTSLSGAIDAVEDMLHSFVTENTFDAIVTSIKKIAQLAVENESQTQKDNYQQQGVISTLESKMYGGYFRTSVEMTYKSGKGYEQLTQTVEVLKIQGTLDFDKCKRHADTIREWDREGIGDWGVNTSSNPFPPNDSPAWDN